MDQKTYLLTILSSLEKDRPAAGGLMVLIEQSGDESEILTIIQEMLENIIQTANDASLQNKALLLQQHITQLQQQEADEHIHNQQTLQDLENQLATL